MLWDSFYWIQFFLVDVCRFEMFVSLILQKTFEWCKSNTSNKKLKVDFKLYEKS